MLWIAVLKMTMNLQVCNLLVLAEAQASLGEVDDFWNSILDSYGNEIGHYIGVDKYLVHQWLDRYLSDYLRVERALDLSLDSFDLSPALLFISCITLNNLPESIWVFISSSAQQK